MGAMMEGGMVPPCIGFFYNDNILQFEATWVLNSLASGTSVQTRSFVVHGAVPGLVKLHQPASPEIVRRTGRDDLGRVSLSEEPYEASVRISNCRRRRCMRGLRAVSGWSLVVGSRACARSTWRGSLEVELLRSVGTLIE